MYHDGTTAHFDYDDRGNRIHVQNEDSTRDRTYDELGRLASVLDHETGRTIHYTYDASGNRTSMRVEPDGQETTYAWDARGNLVRMTDPEGGEYHFAYDDAGRRTTTTYPNGMILRTIYDQASRIVSMVYRNPAGRILESFTYSYDSRGNRTAKIFADGGAELYGYDDLSRLTRATYPSGRSVDYVYDGVGNRLEMTERAGGPAPPCEGDADCDGVTDDFDNCAEIGNADQADTDAPDPLLADTVAYYRLDEDSGTVATDSAGGHDGTLEGGVTRLADGQRSHALRFDGVDDDELDAEKLYVAALDYLREFAESRRELAGLVWHRTFKEVEEASAQVVPRVAEFGGVPLSVSRDFFVLDAAGLAFGDFSVDVDQPPPLERAGAPGGHAGLGARARDRRKLRLSGSPSGCMTARSSRATA